MKKCSLSKDEMAKLLRKLAKQLNKVPSQRDLKGRLWLPSHEIYRRVFNSFPNALESAGLTPNYFPKRYTKEEIKALAVAYYKKTGSRPRLREFKASNCLPDRETVKRHFGNISRLFNEISLGNKIIKEKEIKKNTKVVIQRVKSLYKKYSRVPTKWIYEKEYRDLGPAYIRRVLRLKWSRLLIKSGFDPNLRYYSELDKQLLIDLFESLAKKIKRTPRIQDFGAKNSIPSFPTYTKVFGNYDNLLMITGMSKNAGKYGKYWRMWERFCEEAAGALYGDITTQKAIKTGNRKRPDILVKNKNLRIDAMTSAYLQGRKGTSIIKYTEDGFNVELWCIFSGNEIKHERVKYIYPKELTKQLKKIGRMDLVKRCLDFEKNDVSILKEAGFYTKDELIRKYKKLAQELGKAPTSKDIDKCKFLPHSTTFLSHFKNLGKLARITGFSPNKILATEYSEEYLLNHLRKLRKKLNHRIRKTDIKFKPGVRVYRTVFGTINKALAKADLERLRPQQYSDKELKEHILDLYNQLKRTPISRDFRGIEGKPSYECYTRRFPNKSWKNIIICYGIEYKTKREMRRIPRSLLLQKGKEFYMKNGRLPICGEMKNSDGYPSYSTCCREFGKWSNYVIELKRFLKL
jgi:hypothetical protein